MDLAELTIEGAGLALLGVIMAGVLAAVGEKKRLVLGICLGLALGLVVLPFVAYGVARLTNHQASDVDLAPPTYIVVTALTCTSLAALGALFGGIAELRHAGPRDRLAALRQQRQQDGDAQYRDNPQEWLPWGKHTNAPK